MTKVHLTLVIDRSGSMGSIKQDAEGGVNELISSRKKDICSLILCEFDDNYSEIIYKNIADAPAYKLSPRGSTAMYDAICKAIDSTGTFLSSIPEKDRPDLVLFAIITDGQENASRVFTYDAMKQRITHQTDVYKWQFSFLCTDPTVAKVVTSAGIYASAEYNTDNIKGAYCGLSSKFDRMVSESTRGLQVNNSYTAEELAQITGSNNVSN